MRYNKEEFFQKYKKILREVQIRRFEQAVEELRQEFYKSLPSTS